MKREEGSKRGFLAAGWIVAEILLALIALAAGFAWQLGLFDTKVITMLMTFKQIDNIYNSDAIKSDDADLNMQTQYAIGGWTSAFEDKYGGYMTPESNTEHTNESEEQSFGFGITIYSLQGKGLYIYNVYDNSSADKAGLKVGDIITSVDGTDISEMELTESKKLLGDESNPTKTLGILRGNKEITISAELAPYDIVSVSYNIIDEGSKKIGYIDIDSFTNKTDEEFISAIEELSKSTDKFIIDLRDNSGGYTETVIKMLDYILGEGLIMQVKDKDGNISREYYSDESSIHGTFDVLVNRNTASASELFSQSIKDFDRGKVIGETTFGKGTEISVYQLLNGGAVVFSTGRYTTNKGVDLEGKGVTPDIEVSLSDEEFEGRFMLNMENDHVLQVALEDLK